MRIKLLSWLLLLSFNSLAETQLMLNAGYGFQANTEQNNYSYGADISFYRYDRSPKQALLLGLGYSYLGTDAATNTKLHAISIFPQLNLYALPWYGLQPLFFVRALGPSYLTAKKLGEREQGKHFAFQAQVGAGFYFGVERSWLATISYKHFSNANLFEPNDGIDLPFMLTLARRW